MPLDATMNPGGGSPLPREPVTARSFRHLIERLRSLPAPNRPVVTAEAIAAPAPPPPAQARPAEPPPPPPPPGPGDSATALLDIMWGALNLLPQERTLAGDTLLLLVPRLSHKELVAVAERVSAMEAPPPLLVARLVRDARLDIAGLLLERSAHLNDHDMMAAVAMSDVARLRLIARRRVVSTALSDQLVASADVPTLLGLLRNPGAELSYRAFTHLCEQAGGHPEIQALLATRADLPLPVALELFWRLPPELRRLILSRFLTDSGTLGKILTIAVAADARQGTLVAFEELAQPPAAFDAALDALTAGRPTEAVGHFANLTGLADATVLRILSDEKGEPLIALFKALGLSRMRFEEAVHRIRTQNPNFAENRNSAELQAIFEGLSFNKARVLLIYWDWFMRREGPYAPQPEPLVGAPRLA